jgi:hypothetical protein
MRKWPNKAAADDSGPATKDGCIVPQVHNAAQAIQQKEPSMALNGTGGGESNDADKHMAKVRLLIRARLVVEVHPGPP